MPWTDRRIATAGLGNVTAVHRRSTALLLVALVAVAAGCSGLSPSEFD
jgi:hypothetical protein